MAFFRLNITKTNSHSLNILNNNRNNIIPPRTRTVLRPPRNNRHPSKNSSPLRHSPRKPTSKRLHGSPPRTNRLLRTSTLQRNMVRHRKFTHELSPHSWSTFNKIPKSNFPNHKRNKKRSRRNHNPRRLQPTRNINDNKNNIRLHNPIPSNNILPPPNTKKSPNPRRKNFKRPPSRRPNTW